MLSMSLVRSLASIALLLAGLTPTGLIPTALAVRWTVDGINCRGSSICSNDCGTLDCMRAMIDLFGRIPLDTTYGDGDKVACIDNGGGSQCAVIYDFEGKRVNGATLRLVAIDLSNHGCQGCGSAPLNRSNGNVLSQGRLTVNYETYGCTYQDPQRQSDLCKHESRGPI